jgi:hypothetical protein
VSQSFECFGHVLIVGLFYAGYPNVLRIVSFVGVRLERGGVNTRFGPAEKGTLVREFTVSYPANSVVTESKTLFDRTRIKIDD